jgi:hypothetical protein
VLSIVKKIDLSMHLNVNRARATKLEMDFSMAYDVFEVPGRNRTEVNREKSQNRILSETLKN